MNNIYNENVTKNPNEHPDPSTWWKYRRRLAFLALFFGFFQTIMFTLLAVYSPPALSSLSAVVGFSYGMCTVVIGGYIANTSIDDYMKHKTK